HGVTAPLGAPATGTTPGTGPVSGDGATAFHQSEPNVPNVPNVARLTGTRGVQFGRYTLLDRLGEGGMAEVYTAATFGAEGFRRTFVVKRLRAELVREPAVVAQFIDEANLASTLVHSNIIPVFDFGKVGEEYFMAQEYILGRDLGRLTARVVEREGKPLAANVVLYAAFETLKALEYAHTKLGDNGRPLGIVHRDVSPSNILISARGEVKLFDFGIVKAEGRVTKTQHGVVKGNVSFMSPEQARGVDVDARADLFSLGLVMFYCLAGDVLYKGNTTYELLVKAATGPGADELARIAALPAPCAELVRRALEIDPAQRYASAAEFAAAIAAVHVAGGPAEAARLMSTLFTEDFQKEEGRFSGAMPAAAVPGGGTQSLGTPRS
ncbi:MAG: serine/threonine protein kinase, partial [Myxococcales bacterium]|nr:serine/threonine protein kinase [Myxococcales bacterium]